MADLFEASQQEVDLSMFNKTEKDTTPLNTSSSDKNLIAQATILNGEDPAGTFKYISALEPEERKLAISQISQRAKEGENSANLDIVSTLLQDEGLDDQTKEDMLRAYQGEAIKPYDSFKGTAEKLYATATGKETEAEERRMADLGELINPITDELRLQQEVVTALSFDEGGDKVNILNNFGDLTELLVMFNEQDYARRIRNAADIGEIGNVESLLYYALLGESKVDLKEKFSRLSPEERKGFLDKAFRIMNDTKTFNLLNDNDLIQLDNFMAMTDPSYYTTGDRVLDNIGSMLDAVPVLNIIGRVAKAGYKSLRLEEKVRKIGLRRSASQKQPASVLSLAEQANPEVARSMTRAVADDVTGEAAEIAAGTTRTEAVVDAMGPQVKTPDESIQAKPYAIDKEILEAAYHESSRIERTPAEKLAAKEKISEDLGKVEKLARYDEGATSHTLKDNGSVDISERYIARDGKFSSPEEAVATVLHQLEHYGVKESDIVVLRKQGTEFVPTTAKEAKAKDVIRETATKGEFTPAPQKVLDEVKKEFIQQKKEELMATTSSRLVRGDRKQLLKEKRQLEEALSKVVDEPVGSPAKGKGISARKAKKEAKELAAKLTADEKAIFQERIDLINEKLKSSKVGEEAEADLTRLEQGIVPDRFKQELKDLQDSKGTRTKPTATEGSLPEELKKVNMQDEYAVEVKFNYQPKAVEITRDDLDVKMNFLDRLSTKAPTPGRATLSRYIFQVAHMLNPVVAQASVAAVDRGNRLQKVIMDKFNKGVIEPMESLPREKAELLSKVMHEQNMARQRYKPEQLEQMGITDEVSLSILDNWKYMNDQLWHLSNMDMAKTLREHGYSMYRDVDADSMYIGRNMPRNTPLSQRPSTVFDPAEGKTKLTSDSWAKWEEEGTEIFELKEPQLIDDVEVKHILVRQGDGKRYTKAVQDHDTVMPYIDGWSHIDYKDPFFIERVMVDANGKEIGSTKQAILTAPESTSAQRAVDRLTENASNALKGRTWKYTLRNSRDLTPTDIAMKKFEVTSSAGLSSQRHRGQTLKQFDSSRTGDMAPNIADPLDSFKNSAAELSRRVPMREYLDDLEARIKQKYEKVLPKDERGNPIFPDADHDFAAGAKLGSTENKMMADAKSMIEHYNYMKFGYYNSIDSGWKGLINITANTMGLASRRAEKAVRAVGEEVPSLIGALKGTAFNAHIALSSPPSQWMVQGLPALQNVLIHPAYALNPKGGMASDMRDLIVGITKEGSDADLVKMVGKDKAAHIIKLRDEWNKTGLAVGVDKHLLVENGLEGMMPTNRFQTVKKPLNWLVDKGREIGFDKGETFQLMAFWLAARNDAIKAGKSMDNAEVFDSVRSKTRTLTMNMNKAGEMPWNKDSLSLWTQFMISPYKALTMVGTRGLTAEERVKIGAFQTLVMPLPIAMTYQIRAAVDVEGTEGDLLTETITNGLFGGMVNTVANQIFEDAGSASWQRNVQVDPEFSGLFTLAQVLGGDLNGINALQALAQASPSLSMFEGYNPIVKNLLTSFGKLVTAPLQETKEDEWHYLKAFAGENGALWQYSALTRGLSTAFKELMVDGAAKRYSALSGKVQDEDVSFMESLARGLFGMETSWQTVAREGNTQLYLASKDMRDDVDLILKEFEREATVQGFTMDSPERAPYILRQISSFFPDGRMPPKMATYLMKQLRPDMTLSQKLMSAAGFGIEEREDFYRAMGKAKPEIESFREWDESNRRVGETR